MTNPETAATVVKLLRGTEAITPAVSAQVAEHTVGK
jgi:hypothetical protein